MTMTESPDAALGSSATDFHLPDPRGGSFNLEQCRGRAGLLVVFLSNHCPYVKAIRERLVADCRKLTEAGIGVVAICSNDAGTYPEDGPERMAEIARRFGFEFPYLHDASQAVGRAYGAACTPDFFGYDRELKLRYRGRLDSARDKPRQADTRRELLEAMLQIAARGDTDIEQVPSIGCSIKWREPKT